MIQYWNMIVNEIEAENRNKQERANQIKNVGTIKNAF